MNDAVTTGSATLTLPRGGWIGPLLNDALGYAFKQIDHDTIAKMSVVVYDFPPDGHNGCTAKDCPADRDGAHAIQVMRDQRAASYLGGKSHEPVVDGLSTDEIVDIKAHAVFTGDRSNLDSYQWGLTGPGDPDSFGGVLVEVPLPSNGEKYPVFRFIVTVSGADKCDDDFIAGVVGVRIRRELLKGGIVPLASRAGTTFIVGAAS